MKKRNIYDIVALFIIIGSCFLYFRGYLQKIIYPNSYFLTCTDFGQYLIEVRDYLSENTYLADLLKVGEEPGLFIVASNIGRITNMPSENILTIFSMIMYCINGLMLYLLSNKITGKNQYITGIICIIIYVSLPSNINSYLSGIWRQMIGHLFFLAFLLSCLQGKGKANVFIPSLFFAMCIISHRLYTVVGILPILCFLFISFKGNKTFFKKYTLILGMTVILCAPYLYLYVEYVFHYIKYTMYVNSLPPTVRGDFTIEATPKYLGYSFFGPEDQKVAIMHFLFYQSWIFLAGIAFCKNIIKKASKIYLLSLLVLIIYISFKIDFSIRILLLFQIVLLPIIAGNLSYIYKKNMQILIVVTVFLFGSLLSGGVLKRVPIKKYDEGIYFLLNNLNPRENHFFMGSICSGDLLSQIGFVNLFNFHMGLKNVEQKKKNQELDYYDLANISAGNINLLKRDGILFDFFKDKKTYLLFLEKDAQEVNLIKKGTSGLIGKEYLHLIYPEKYDKPGVGIIKYIFLVDGDRVQYTDTSAYINEIVSNFNLDQQ